MNDSDSNCQINVVKMTSNISSIRKKGSFKTYYQIAGYVILIITIGMSFYLTYFTPKKMNDQGNITNKSSKAVSQIPAWQSCPAGSNSCSNGYQCCIGPYDAAFGKYTCRTQDLCAPTIANYNTCQAGSSLCNPGFICCIGPIDQSIKKYTCRPTGQCSVYDDWSDCPATSDNCRNGLTCCIAPEDTLAKKFTCRLPAYCTCDPNYIV